MAQIFRYRKTFGGKLVKSEVPIEKLIVTRPTLRIEKVHKYRKPTKKYTLSGVIEFNGKSYLVDGHHKTAANYLNGEKVIRARVLKGGDPAKLELVLKRRSQGSMESLLRKMGLIS
ncbi:MAG: hypothetical protein ABH854_02120 [Candidatus Diapherotrites archaeon]